MKQILKLLLCVSSLQAPLFASYAPLTGTESDAQSKRLLELETHRVSQDAAPIVQQVPAPSAQHQLNNQPPTCGQRCQRSPACGKAIWTTAFLCTVAVIFVPTYYLTRPKPSWYPCAEDNDDMSSKCFTIKISDCGTCTDDQFSHARCGYQGPLTAGQLATKVSLMLNTTCGMSAKYCVSDVACAESIWVCDTDNLAGFKNAVQKKCASNKPAQHLRTKFMKRSNKGRKK